MDSIRNKIKQSKSLVGPFPAFDLDVVPEYPHDLFLEWFDVALHHDVHEPHAMTLSTIDYSGSPDARILILKDVDEDGWYFASSCESKKGKQLEANNHVALTFYWSLIGRQVRIRGKVEKMDIETNKKDFLHRGVVARAVSFIGKQSSVLHEQNDFNHALAKQLHYVQENSTSVYPAWTVYRVVAGEVEFWQADEERKHRRLLYRLVEGQWHREKLWP
ncbi:pyridoxine/pyridoxamine 5'-phosphate oxidase [Priestia taiwanensis]|uniref:Pyridoxamine 5'-phosphate oxidase n=1 Tax=Priestia taiwanensis TaxID=1347902 RepID=A0A917ASM7_9BACI|nr:pyridoxal 5'-phosphate synthase [Priestia taiwanensis]MBM7364182.1 pyridoxamine 5'-phosphate oxidase [Priestia taiwanensis]GGE72288.1 pyridoxamine 5'-phosphate oxidase [Priestia taiwanensis]